jgi:argininosuccinate lyase
MEKVKPIVKLGAREGRLTQDAADDHIQEFYVPVVEGTVHLFEWVLKYNKAHVVMLAEQKVIDVKHAAAVIEASYELEALGGQNIELNPRLLGIYPNVEALTIDKVGLNVGGVLYTGRSRNDAQRVPDRLANRALVLECMEEVIKIRNVTLDLAEKHVRTLMLNTATLQHSQPTTFGFYLLWFVDAMEADFERIMDAWKRLNMSSAEIGVGMTTSFPVDRFRVAELLGFEGIIENALYAHRSIDREIEIMSVMSMLLLDIYRLFEDLLLWCSSDVDFVEIDGRYCSTSFMMAQKKNPMGLLHPQMVAMIVHQQCNLLYDFARRTTSDVMFHGTQVMPIRHAAMKKIPGALRATRNIIPGIKPHPDKMQAHMGEAFAQATDLSDALVRECGLSYREAYLVVGRLVRLTEAQGKTSLDATLDLLNQAAEEVLKRKLNLSLRSFSEAMDPLEGINAKRVVGGVSPEIVGEAIKRKRQRVSEHQDWLESKRAMLAAADEKLTKACAGILAQARS